MDLSCVWHLGPSLLPASAQDIRCISQRCPVLTSPWWLGVSHGELRGRKQPTPPDLLLLDPQYVPTPTPCLIPRLGWDQFPWITHGLSHWHHKRDSIILGIWGQTRFWVQGIWTQRLFHLIISGEPSHNSENTVLPVHSEVYACYSVFILIVIRFIYIQAVVDKAIKIFDWEKRKVKLAYI